MGGLRTGDLRYGIFRNDVNIDTIDASSPSTNFTTSDSNILITGVKSLHSVYIFTVQLEAKDEIKKLQGIAALPPGSPSLILDTLCDLTG